MLTTIQGVQVLETLQYVKYKRSNSYTVPSETAAADRMDGGRKTLLEDLL